MAARRSWRSDAVNLAEFDAWDRGMRKRLGFFAGLIFFQRHGSDNRTAWTVAARHWPHKLCWDWCVHWTPWKEHYDGPRRLRAWLPSYNSTGIECWFGRLSLAWQHYDHMANVGPIGMDAPKIIWKRDMDTANFKARTDALTR